MISVVEVAGSQVFQVYDCGPCRNPVSTPLCSPRHSVPKERLDSIGSVHPPREPHQHDYHQRARRSRVIPVWFRFQTSLSAACAEDLGAGLPQPAIKSAGVAEGSPACGIPVFFFQAERAGARA